MEETILCPSGQQVTKEDCEQCLQCHPSRWTKETNLKGAIGQIDNIVYQ